MTSRPPWLRIHHGKKPRTKKLHEDESEEEEVSRIKRNLKRDEHEFLRDMAKEAQANEKNRQEDDKNSKKKNNKRRASDERKSEETDDGRIQR